MNRKSPMNAPHVTTLRYRIIPHHNVDYNNAPPVVEHTDDFLLRIQGEGAIFEMKKHFASAEEARKVVDEYLGAWEMLIGLEHDPGDLSFAFQKAQVIDLSPPPQANKQLNLQAHISGHSVTPSVSVHISFDKYPSRPQNFVVTPDVETMYLRYNAYRHNRESLTSMAYMCLTILELGASGRKEAAKQYSIEFSVLDILGRFCSTKGDPTEARKAPRDGKFLPLTQGEKGWIIEVIKALIRRAGEWAYDRSANLPKLSLADFPKLEGSNP